MKKNKIISKLLNRKTVVIVTILFLGITNIHSQSGAAINTTGASPDPSSVLDISSTNAGLLIPRMSEAQKLLIPSPATGLMIYQTDGVSGFWYWEGTAWVQSTGSAGATGPTGQDGATGATGFLTSGSAAGNTPYWDGTQWVVNSSHIFNNGNSVGIGTNTPDASSSIDLGEVSKGFLINRMSTTERNAINNPAEGLQIFNTTTNCFEAYVLNSWKTISCPANCFPPSTPGIISGDILTCPGSSLSYSINPVNSATTYKWTVPVGWNISVGQGTTSINVISGNNGQNGDIGVTADNTCGASAAQSLAVSVVDTPLAPAESTHGISETQIIWNWNAAVSATGYKYNTTNNYATATDNGTSTTYTQTGLNCASSYNLYVWAYSICGTSQASSLSSATAACSFTCGNNITFNYAGSSVTYGTVTSQNNRCWLDRNLGASQVATSVTHSSAYGDFFQWGRGVDGHQLRTSSTTTVRSSTDTPGHSLFIVHNNAPNDWRDPQNDNLWQAPANTNNPCPTGWRVPTLSEFTTESSSYNPQNKNGAFQSPLKLTAGGFRQSSGVIELVGQYGYYQCSTVNGIASHRAAFGDNDITLSSYHRARAMSVRCIKDN